ncbi:hypothetical protein [Pseudomonas baltica]|uniref:hypothetical protein n=1 Tax=Pseudomonas baltica TaxID=2762576 RepID=UPI0028A27C64|nr:hypothetical protein [Pseudomonas baltica]
MATQTFPAAMGGSLLVLNAGSSSLKFSLYHGNADEQGERLAQGQGSLERRGEQWVLSFIDRLGKAAEERWPLPLKAADALERLLPWIEARTGAPWVAAGHRGVHGGLRQEVAALVDETLLTELQALAPIAPQTGARRYPARVCLAWARTRRRGQSSIRFASFAAQQPGQDLDDPYR